MIERIMGGWKGVLALCPGWTSSFTAPMLATVLVFAALISGGEGQGGLMGDLQELCTNEMFKATCAADEIIEMTEANYGRMRKSRCVVRDYGFIGCYGNVLHIADDMCSGRQSCLIRVPNEHLDAVSTGCPADFKSYFEARYVCVKVATPAHGSCRPDTQLILTSPTGVLSSIVTSQTRCGDAHAPWVIQVPAGQRINLTLTDYSYGSKTNAADHSQCYGYATVKDLSTQRSSTICGGRSRESHVYTSLGNKLQVVLFTGSSGESAPRYFSINYQAIGCPDPVTHTQGWFRRHGDRITVGCNDSADTRTATCNGTAWDPLLHNCTLHVTVGGQTSAPFLFSLSYEIAIVIIIALALVIASVILCVGVICMRRLRDERNHQLSTQHRLYPDQPLPPYPTPGSGGPQYGDTGPLKSPPSYEQYRVTGENLYASIQDSMLPIAPPGEHPKVPGELCTCPSGPGPYSCLEQSPGGCPEPISPTSRSEGSSIFPGESGRPYYVLDPREGELEQ